MSASTSVVTVPVLGLGGLNPQNVSVVGAGAKSTTYAFSCADAASCVPNSQLLTAATDGFDLFNVGIDSMTQPSTFTESAHCALSGSSISGLCSFGHWAQASDSTNFGPVSTVELADGKSTPLTTYFSFTPVTITAGLDKLKGTGNAGVVNHPPRFVMNAGVWTLAALGAVILAPAVLL